MAVVRYALIVLVAVVVSFVVHEFSHWLTGELLGNDMVMTLNTCYPKAQKYLEESHYTVVSATGPIVTLLQAILVFILIKRSGNRNLYPWLFTPFYIELLSGIMNFINPNDLGRISVSLGLPLFTLSVIFVAVHVVLVRLTSKQQQYGWKFNMATLGWVMLFSSIWILTNNALKVVLID